MTRQAAINEILVALIATLGRSFAEYQKIEEKLPPGVVKVALYQLALLNKSYDLLEPLMPEFGTVTLEQAEQNWIGHELNKD